MLQRPPPALLTTDAFIPAHNTTTCTMRPLGKAAAASGKAANGTRPGVHCGVWEGRRRRSSRARHAACESSRRPPARPATWRQRLDRVKQQRPPYSARKVGCSWPPWSRWPRRRHLCRPRRAPLCRRNTPNMIPSEPMCWTPVPSGQLSGPRNSDSLTPNVLVVPPIMVSRSEKRSRGRADRLWSSHWVVHEDPAPAVAKQGIS